MHGRYGKRSNTNKLLTPLPVHLDWLRKKSHKGEQNTAQQKNTSATPLCVKLTSMQHETEAKPENRVGCSSNTLRRVSLKQRDSDEI